ncbi:MAG: 50S ribosomal protein L25 [Bacillota bacterium]
MAKSINLECVKREKSTKGRLNSLRRQDMVPGIIYGKDVSATPLAFRQADLTRIFRTRGTGGLYKLSIRGEEPVMALLRDVQRKPMTGEIIHVDFMQVKMTENITAAVPVVVVGDEELVKQGAILQAGLKEVEVECLPGNLPESLHLDISGRSMGDTVLVQDLEHPEGVRIVTDPDTVALVISHPAREVTEIEEPGEDTTGEEAAGGRTPGE